MNPLWQLSFARIREFYREPAALFWVYGFPLLIAVALGIAFRDRPVEKLHAEVICDGCTADTVAQFRQKLAPDSRLMVTEAHDADWKKRLRSGKVDVAIAVTVSPSGEEHYDIWDEKNRPESVLAHSALENALLKAARTKPLAIDVHHLEEKGISTSIF